MSDEPPTRDAPGVIAALLARYLADRDDGRCATADDYRRLFPGFEDVVDAQLAALERERTSAAESASDGPSLGRYRLLRPLGRGGQGVVHLALDPRLGRRVALKVLIGPLAHDAVSAARFRREAEAASSLDDPGICTVYEVGEADGVAFIAMRYVEGRSLAESIRERTQDADAETTFVDLSVDDAAAPQSPASEPRTASRAEVAESVRIIEACARSIHAAHEAGLIHRDLKPGNIMIATDGAPVILDFGLARYEDDQGAGLTRTGDVLGTPAYLAPEQIAGPAGSLDRRVDVYALGVTLYECVTGRRPFAAPTRERLYHRILRGRHVDVRRVDRGLPRDVATVIETAMERDPDRRYRTAADLAEDLRRVRRHEPIRARPVPAAVRGIRWTRRNPLVATLGALLIIGAAVFGIWSRQKNVELGSSLARTLDEKDAHRAARERSDALRLAAESTAIRGDDAELALLLATEALRIRDEPVTRSALYGALDALQSRPTLDIGDASGSWVAPGPAGRVVAVGLEEGGMHLLDVATGTMRWTAALTGCIPRGAVFDRSAPDRIALLVADFAHRPIRRPGPNTVIFARLTDGAELGRVVTPGGVIDALTMDPTGRFTVTSTNEPEPEATLWDLATFKPIATLHADGIILDTVIRESSEGGPEALSATRASLYTWGPGRDAELGALLLPEAPIAGHELPMFAARFSPDAERLVMAADERILLRDLASGATVEIARNPALWDSRVSFAPLGEFGLVASSNADGTSPLLLFNARTASARATLGGLGENPVAAAFVQRPGIDGTPYDTHVAALYRDGSRRVWDVFNGHERVRAAGRGRTIRSAAFSADGRLVAAIDADGVVRAWTPHGPSCLPGARDFYGTPQRFSFRGGRLVTVSHFAVQSFDGPTGATLAARRFEALVSDVGLSPDGSRVAVGEASGRAVLLSALDLAEVAELQPARAGGAVVAFDEAGARLAVGSASRELLVCDAATGRVLARGKARQTSIGIHFLPSGSQLLVESPPAFLDVYEIAGAKIIRQEASFLDRVDPGRTLDRRGGAVLVGPRLPIHGPAPDLEELRVAILVDQLRRWPRRELGHGGAVTSGALDRDGRFAVTGDATGLARIWDAETGHAVREVRSPAPVSDVSLTPDGDLIAIGCTDGAVRVVERETGREVFGVRHDAAIPPRLDFDESGAWLAVLHGPGHVTLYPMDVLAFAQARAPRELTDEERRRYGAR